MKEDAMKLTSSLILAAAPLALAACNQERPGDRPATAPAATVVGEAQSCLPLTSYRTTRIRDDWTIDFIAAGGKAWRNTLPNRCPGLKSDDAFTFETSLTQLCSTDIIYTLRHVGSSLERGAGCGLGQFVPVKLDN
jgi:hypothetical protein